MKLLRILILLPVVLVVAGCSGGGQDMSDADLENNLTVCRGASKKLGGHLKAALQGAVQEGGPLAAVDVCHEKAPVIAAGVANDEGVKIGRVSRKFRNPANAPDAWESAGLEAFASRIAAGEKPADLEMWAVVDGPGEGQTFRYLKAIGTAPLCVSCHGETISPELEERLAKVYPDDRARGFSVGDMRGAFTVQFVLPRPEKSEG